MKYEKLSGNEPDILWSEIYNLLKETLLSFPGIKLDVSYMCPRCVLELKDRLSLLPNNVTSFAVHIDQRTQEVPICAKGHVISATDFQRGWSTGKMTNESLEIKCLKGIF